MNEKIISNSNQVINEFGEKIKGFDTDIQNLITYDSINIIYVDSINGSDTYDGSQEKPFKTAEKAFDYLCSLGSKALFKQWKIKFNKGVYRSVKVSNLPQFSYPLLIEGTVEYNQYVGDESTRETFKEFEIVSKFVYEDGSSSAIGLWLEPVKGNAIHLKWLRFENYRNGFNGYGVIAKNQGYLYVYECEAVNCECGFAGVNNVTLTCQRTIVNGCREGFRNLYNGCVTIGAGTGGKHMYYVDTSDGLEKTGNGCEVYNCDIGFLLSRNSVAHSDYVKYKNCVVGMQAEMNSRVATLANVYDGCKIGVNCVGGAEWIGGIGNEIDIWLNVDNWMDVDGNIPYDLHGNSRCSRVQSLYGKLNSTFFRKVGSDVTTSSITGTTAQTEIFRASPSIESIPQYYLYRGDVTVEVIIKGTFKQSSGQTIKLLPILRGLNEDNTINGKNISMGEISIPTESTNLCGFRASFKLEFNKNEHLRYVEYLLSNTTGGNRIATAPYLVQSSANREGKKQLLLNATLSNASSELNILSIEMVLSN